MVRAKFKCFEKSEPNSDGNSTVKLEAVTSGSPENDAFFRNTPWGRLEFGTVNKAAADQIEVGKEYFVDLSPAQ